MSIKFFSFAVGILWFKAAYADRFGRAEYGDETSAPIELVLYLIITIVLFIHEKSPLHEWASDNKYLSWGVFVFLLPVLYRISPEFTVGIFALSALIFTLLILFWPKIRAQNISKPVATNNRNNPVISKPIESSTTHRDDPAFIDRAIEYAYAYDVNDLRDAVKDIARRMYKKYPGQYPPLKSSLDENGEVLPWCEESTNFYDMFLDYVIHYGYPNSLTDDEKRPLSTIAKNIKSQMTKEFPGFSKMDDQDIGLSIAATAIFRAIHILDNKKKENGVMLNFSPMKKKLGLSNGLKIPSITFQ